MNKNKIVSAPIRIKLLDTTTIYQQEQIEYPQITIQPSPSHYPQWIDSVQKQPLCTTSDTEEPATTTCFLFDIFCCCK
jgi:hypothetical protein